MRLINADKLMESINPKESVWVGLVLSELVDNAPTVKAIPIEWIKNEIASSIAVVRDNDYDYTYASCIMQLLERWEKENEWMD